MTPNLKGWVVLVLLLGTLTYALAEEITLTTYYPSPRGVYHELRTAGNVQIGLLDPPFLGNPLPRLHLVQSAAEPALRVDDEAPNGALLDATPFLIDAAGNVGIGTMSPDPAAKLDVAGSVKIVDGTQGAGEVLTSDANGLASWQPSAIPSGAVMFFSLPACPPGWSEPPTLRGRYIVGLPAGGTLGGLTGTPLSNGENRATGSHSHNLAMASGPVARVTGGVPSEAAIKPAGPTLATEVSGGPAGTNAPYIQLRGCLKD